MTGGRPTSDAGPLAAPCRDERDEFVRDGTGFDGVSTLYANDDLRALIGYDPEGAWRHWLACGPREDRYPSGVARAAPRRFDPAAAPRPFGLNVFGPFDAISGLGTAARNLAAAVAASGVPHELRPHDVEGMHARVTADESARPFRFAVNLVLANADQIRRLVSLYPDGRFDDAYTIAVWAWELAAFRHDFTAAFALVDEVWTNSRFELGAIAAAAPVPVHLVPLPVPAAALPGQAAARAQWGLPGGAFVVLCPFDAGSTERRKNPFAAIRAFRAAFGPDPRRILLVKHHGGDRGRESGGGRESEGSLRARIAAATGGAPNIRVVAGRLPEAEMRSLRAAADAVISAHRSEGFGLNLAEFQASGRVVIATDATGSRDFLDEDTGFPVPARLAVVGVRTGPYGADAVWAEPDEAALVARLREAAAADGGRAARAAARMATAFSPAVIGARMRTRLEALGLHERRPGWIAATAGLSTALHVPPDPAREGLAWPARMPMLSVVPLAATRAGRARAVAALVAQLYPFWEACLADPDLPPSEDAEARHALRGPDLRVRLVDPAGGGSAVAAAVAASGGPFVVLLPEDAALAPDALFAAACALDRAAPPALLTLGGGSAGGGHAVVVAKALLLDHLDGAEDGAALLRRLANPTPALVPDAMPLPDAVIALRFADAATQEAWGAALGDAGRFDLALAERAPDDVRRLSERLARAGPAENVVLVGAGAPAPERGWAAGVAAVLAAPGHGALASARSQAFATTRRTLARIARLEPAPGDFREAVERLGLLVVSPDADEGETETSDPQAWPALTRVGAGELTRLGAGELTRPRAGELTPLRAGELTPLRAGELTLDEHVARVRALGVFDAAHYLEAAPDVAAGGADPLRHYCEHGWREHRAPNFYFDPAWYRARYMRPDDAGIDPLLHWERYRNSGVRPSRWFDPAHVRRTGLLPPGTDPLRYVLDRRRDGNVSPVPGFDPAFYRARRRDMAYRRTDPFEHYMRFGAAEGVNPAPGFDTRFYRATQMRRMPADPVLRNPLLHYLAVRESGAAVVTSQNAALHLAVARLRAAGAPAIALDFAWYDGLPYGIEALRTYLADPTLTLPFRLAFANETIVSASLDPRLRAGLRLVYDDAADDPDICERLAECVRDPRCLRHEGRPVLAFARGGGGGALERFAERIAGGVARITGTAPTVVIMP